MLNDEHTFAYWAEQWLTFKSAELVTKSISGFNGALNNHILLTIGKKPVSEIKLEHIPTIITELRRQRTMAIARRVRTIIRAVLGFAEAREDQALGQEQAHRAVTRASSGAVARAT